MARKILNNTEFTFNAAAKTITFTEAYQQQHIELITNITCGCVIYQFNRASLGGTMSGNVLTLNFNTATQNNADVIQVYVNSDLIANSVEVSNFPAEFEVSNFPNSFGVNNFPSSFQVSNFPMVQPISGDVSVSNFPSSTQVSNFPSAFGVNNFPASFQVSNFPASTQVSNFPSSFQVSNFPSIQTVSVNNFPGSTEPQTWQWIVPSTAVGANKVFLDLFNASGSGKVIKIHAITPIVDTDVAVVGALGIRVLVVRTSTVGTGGTAWSLNGGVDVAGGSISPLDTTNTALPAQITARHLPTGGGTEGAWLRGAYLMGEESATSMAYMFQGQLNMAQADDGTQKITLREGQGLKIKQGAIASVGNIRFRILFTVE